MSSGKWAVVLAMLLWWLSAAIGQVCFAGQKAVAPAAPDLSALARRARPAVGVLKTFDTDGKPLSQGTAFFVRADGVGITCHHVLEGAASALVRMENGTRFSVVGRLADDPVRDLTLFKVTAKNIRTVSLGNSSTLRPGQRVVAITAPEGLGNTVADGILSAVRELPLGSMVQVTVPLSPGSSGGPIFDLSGKVVAVAAAVSTEGQALNFAIPINAAKPLLAHPGELVSLSDYAADMERGAPLPPSPAKGAKAHALWLQGMGARSARHYQGALEYLHAALELDPTLYSAHCCLGDIYDKLGRHEEAIVAYKEAIRLKPDNEIAHYNLAVTYGHLSRDQEAVDELKLAVRLKPDDVDAHDLLGLNYFILHRYQD